jgi:hypothetical protein
LIFIFHPILVEKSGAELFTIKPSKVKEKLQNEETIKLFHGHCFFRLMKYRGRPGAYIIFSAKNGKNMPIRRFLAVDKYGILYMGGTKDLYKRLYKDLRTSLNSGRSTLHLFGRRYNDDPRTKAKFPPESLYIKIIPGEDYLKIEKELKVGYKQIFGEYTPMNVL